ncbi:MAG: Flp pilus assembly complex ATPase component TadA [Pirellulales bacterium]|nr:Flp pilus assembly complex ATPase component TadA [Pirellulales bacterium]
MRKIGQILVDLGFIDDTQLEMLLEEQRESRSSELLGAIAQSLNLITDDQLAQALAEQWNLQVFAVAEVDIPSETLAYVSETMANLYRVIPVVFKDNTLVIATAEPQKLQVLDELRNFLGFEIRPVVTTDREIDDALRKYYHSGETITTLIDEIQTDKELEKAAKTLMTKTGPINLDDVGSVVDSAPVRKLLNMVLLLAIKDKASDLHFEPFEDEFKIRIKADGVLYEMVPPPRHLAFAITTRIKVMANLDIAERRMPQDGRIELTVGGHPVDLRVAVLPTMFGESVVLRVLDRSVVKLDINEVGMDAPTITAFREVAHKPNGIVLVTGPTGSGKTTTLYSILNELNKVEDKIITTEDPIEYDIDGLVQVPIDHDIGVTFASCLRAILRQDPDKILVGEIRDYETAEIAIQASLTGHIVFSTLHTNDAPGTITRLRDMGIAPFMVTATVEAILAQRLVRSICKSCREETTPSEEMIYELRISPEDAAQKTFYRGRGCDSCNNTGYKGRSGLFELMVLNDTLREMIVRNATTDELRETAREYGMIPLRDSGMEAVYEGRTTVDEVVRETIVES